MADLTLEHPVERRDLPIALLRVRGPLGARLVRHTRRLEFQLAEVALPRALFQGVLDHPDGIREGKCAFCAGLVY